MGAKGSEMDVQMTKDSVLVLFHNTKLEDDT
ncbi:MAG: glycerophosphodiester phosphodiesterase family protein [Bacteroidia bacterium]